MWLIIEIAIGVALGNLIGELLRGWLLDYLQTH